MPNVNDVFAGNSFTSAGLGDDEPVLTIKGAKHKTIEGQNGGKTQQKIIITFSDDDREFWCNKINAMRIAKSYGADTEKWIGKKIQLYVDHEVEFGGKFVDGIRVRLPKTSPAQQAASFREKVKETFAEDRAPFDDDIEF